ncbi:D-serine deaminase-like pyridoxal phosphate-dependent protein [Paenibacillus castaneae]|uniref:alanine racemase n=1 Tax=Paenibacillus castaneae TaxID=474957 RepID=UPI000C9B5457|nr:alanine racemase [Paenibacillus castaneae]NIK78703.1 D-serine deaminase-like pyridoxal phosphate-dependent protein [Paenibacillus castaneae]
MKKEELDTPYVVIDMNKVERNIEMMQKTANEAGIGLRPHAKTHKLPILAYKQIAAGAIGITVAKLGEAEVMAASGISDILIAYPIVGRQKIDRLFRIAKQVKVTVAVDCYETALAISNRFSEDQEVSIGMIVEMDSGFKRVGVPPREAVLELAEKIAVLPGIQFRGLMTFAGHSYDAVDIDGIRQVASEEGTAAVQTAELLRARGLNVDMVSVGSTPTSRFVSNVPGITEIRPGTYIFGDLMQVSMGVHELQDCALTVKVTIVSRPSRDRAVIDAGTKVFTMDGSDSPLGTGRGYVVNHPGIQVSWFTEEHGMLCLPVEEQHLTVGDTLEIIPIHCCAVVNMFDEVAAVRNDEVIAIWPVLGRGKVR